MKSLIVIFFFTVIFISCSYSNKDFNLSADERTFLYAFQAGDTLYYESTTKDIDTIIVLGIDSIEKREMGWIMAKPAYKNVWVSIKHIPVDTFLHSIFYDSLTMKNDTGYTHVISICKIPQSKKVQFAFGFKRFSSITETGLGKLYKDTTINSTVLSDYYIIENDWKENQKAPTDVERVYWTRCEGLVAYKYNNGTYWTKKSSR